MNAVILSGTTIGNNVIVGAGSIVSGLTPSNVVVAGGPARVICGIDDYRKKSRGRQLSEAVNLYLRYTHRCGCELKKAGAKRKVSIPGKNVDEVGANASSEVSDDWYAASIIGAID